MLLKKYDEGMVLGVRDSILAAGAALLREQGIAAISQPKVATAAGVKQSHLTYYFPTRADLLLGIADRIIVSMMGELEARLAERPQRDRLAESVAKVMIDGIPPRVIIGLIVAADADPAIRKSLRKLIKYVRVQVRELLLKAGLADSAEAALLFHATVVGLAVMHQARMSRESVREVKDGIAGMLSLLIPASPGSNKGAP